MSDFVIATDTSADLPQDYIQTNKIPIVSLYYIIDDITYGYKCQKSLPVKDFYAKMRAGATPKTQQVNPEQAVDIFSAVLEQGKDILYIGFSSGLSGTTNSCVIAAEELKEKYPQRKIAIVDTLAASLGEGLLVHYALRMQKHGKSMQEIVAWLEENKLHLCHNFTVEDLVYLQRGGRISKATAFFGTMIGVKPVLHVDNEGKLVPVSKVRGRKQSINALVDLMEEKIGNYRDKNEVIFISHGDCLDEAKQLAQLVQKRFGYDKFLLNDVGAAIGAHSGPGTLALFFLGDHR